MDAAMKTSIKLCEYDDILSPRDIYSLLALTSFSNKFYAICSQAFVKLETLQDTPADERDAIETLAVKVFVRNAPSDPISLPEVYTRCLNVGKTYKACVASGRFVLCYVMLCYAMLWCATLWCAMLCYAMLCYAMLCCAVLCCAVLCYAVLCYAMLCCAMLCCAVLCCAVLCCAMLCCAMLCCAMLCCTINSIMSVYKCHSLPPSLPNLLFSSLIFVLYDYVRLCITTEPFSTPTHTTARRAVTPSCCTRGGTLRRVRSATYPCPHSRAVRIRTSLGGGGGNSYSNRNRNRNSVADLDIGYILVYGTSIVLDLGCDRM
jgi:hypothetical protein